MTIVCGTDFSDASAGAGDAAAALAAAWKDDLLLVHVLEGSDAKRAAARESLARETDRLSRRSTGVKSEVATGSSDSELVEVARRSRARLIVVGALGNRGGSFWGLGSTADRVAQASEVPVLVVRGGALAEVGKRPLRVLVGVDATPTSDAAIGWVTELESSIPCEILFGHVYWPPEVRASLRKGGGIPIGKGHPDVEGPLDADLRRRIEALRKGKKCELRMLGGLGRVADHLVQIAEEERSDLVVVGTRQERGLARVWHGSVSHGVIDSSPVSAVSVPS